MADSTGSFTTYANGIGFGFSAITAALGSFNASSAQQQSYKYQATVQANNVQIAGYQASAALNKGATLEENSELENAAVFSNQRATMAANGVDLSEGSARDVLASTKFIGGVDATTIHNNALNEAWGYQVAGVNASNASAFYAASANNINPGMSGLSSLLTSASSVASKWYTNKFLGVPGY